MSDYGEYLKDVARVQKSHAQNAFVEFKPGVYRHYKGGLYYAFFLTEDSNNGPDGAESTQELEVVYMALDGMKAGQRCNRKLKQWNETVIVKESRPADIDDNETTVDVEYPRFKWVRS